ncbi:hypothetical protein DB313_04615 (plasmid) [Borrelia turcica IST7]|uniref:Outer surface protein n=1 Tax=Borrelia turcica IST7 TaxID=1104446 RepID=A0A386PMG0_9SPIR|nr:BBA14 family lipoprotein [Borrelia turcica]AYE36784.1 hypothetical protein DB313_04615 [Borrelia turcica IST7]
MNKKRLTICLLFSFILLSSCTSIASLPQEPATPVSNTLQSLSIYEAHLSSYVMYLQTFLVKTKEKFRDKDYPQFSFFDATLLKKTHTIDAVKQNIEHLKHYISITKPIVNSIYKKYSKLKK